MSALVTTFIVFSSVVFAVAGMGAFEVAGESPKESTKTGARVLGAVFIALAMAGAYITGRS